MSGQKFSLSFTKTIEKRTLQPSAIRNDVPHEAKINTETLESIEENVLKTDAKPKEPELVIPLISTDRLGILRKLAEKKLGKDGKLQEVNDSTPNKSKDDVEEGPKVEKVLTLDEQAEAAILEETKKKLENWTERGNSDSLTISHGKEDDSVDERPPAKESSLDDYDQVEVSIFGAALLRGMGWKKAEGIGRHTKQVVEVIDPTAKTFGLANTPGDGVRKARENSSGDQEELLLSKGSYVFIHSGRHRGTYGIVETLDEDHLLVKSAVGQEVIREVELNLKVVSQKEYKDSSRVINKDMYDKYKEEETRKNDKSRSKSSKSAENDKKEKEIKVEKLSVEKSDVKEKVKLEKNLEADRKEYENEAKAYKDKINQFDVTKKFADDHNSRKHEERRPIKKEKEQDKLDKHSDSGKYKSDNRYRYETKDKHGRKSDSSRDTYSLHENKNAGKSQYHEETRHEKYREIVDERYSRRSESASESKTYKRKEKKLNDYRDDYKKAKMVQDQLPAMPWVCENLRVRLINKDYKGGRYHKEKVIIFLLFLKYSNCIFNIFKVLNR
ncbi:G-patch domain and KOW motifs-containing protein-like [Palaemon carinicauda]|uniref:G-patch domain and KOW motifs-containing protein-like n=1 Tax=Palaemon carinicauda TaxID=392227 RepID=UPI0035B5BE81